MMKLSASNDADSIHLLKPKSCMKFSPILSIAFTATICFITNNIIQPYLLKYGTNDYYSTSFISGFTITFSFDSILILVYKKKITNNKKLISLLIPCLLFHFPFFEISTNNLIKLLGCSIATIVIFILYKKYPKY